MACEYCTCCGSLEDLDCTDGSYVKGKYYCEGCYVDEWLCEDCGVEKDEMDHEFCLNCMNKKLGKGGYNG